MNKVLAIVMAAVMVLTLGVTAFAAGINDEESKLLNYCKEEYQTKEDSVYIKLPADIVTKAETYLNMVDITTAQFTAAQTQIDALKNLIRTELTVDPSAKTLNLADVSDDFYNKALVIFKDLATALNATVIISEDFDRNNPTAGGSVCVQDKADDKNVVYIFGEPDTAAGVNVGAVVCGVSAVVVAIIAVAVVLAKKKASANA